MQTVFKMKYGAIIFSLFLCCLVVGAQFVEQNAEQAIKRYSFSVLFLDYSQNAINEGSVAQFRWHYISDKKPFKLSFSGGGVSRDYTYKGSSDLTFYNETLTANGEKSYQPLLKVALGKPGRKLVIIFGDGKGNYRGVAKEMGEGELPIDTVMLLNLSKYSVAAKIGEGQSQIDSMDSTNFSVSGVTKRFRIPLAMAVSKNERVEIIEKRKIAFTQGDRKLVILFPDRRRPDDLSYLIHGVVELPPVDYYEEEFDVLEEDEGAELNGSSS